MSHLYLTQNLMVSLLQLRHILCQKTRTMALLAFKKYDDISAVSIQQMSDRQIGQNCRSI